MVEFKPTTWAALIGMMILIVAPLYFMDTTPPAKNEPELDPFGFDRSTSHPNNTSDNKAKDNKANDE